MNKFDIVNDTIHEIKHIITLYRGYLLNVSTLFKQIFTKFIHRVSPQCQYIIWMMKSISACFYCEKLSSTAQTFFDMSHLLCPFGIELKKDGVTPRVQARPREYQSRPGGRQTKTVCSAIRCLTFFFQCSVTDNKTKFFFNAWRNIIPSASQVDRMSRSRQSMVWIEAVTQ